MPSITTWIRLEPRSRNAEMNSSLQARIYDPLWMLTRQWQLGEFQGEDNGSPVIARWRAEGGRLTRYFPGAIPRNTTVDAPHYDVKRIPLETLVEREPIRLVKNQGTEPNKLRLAAEAGQHFLRMIALKIDLKQLSKDYRKAFIRQYPIPTLTPEQRAILDQESLNYYNFMASRVPDGRRLYAAFLSTGAGKIFIDPALQVTSADLTKVVTTAEMWMQWFDTLFSEPHTGLSPWLPERMEYAFSVSARLNVGNVGEQVLTASEYFEGHLDWYHFDANAKAAIGAASDNIPADITRSAIPAPASFRGMPAMRFWECEDAQVDFGSVDAGPTDLSRMLLVEFALAYGNDWFVLPSELEIGNLYRTHSLVITDTFGIRTLIQPTAADSTWRMFEHSHLRGEDLNGSVPNLFFLSPSLLKSLESRPIEEVLFLRDEMANLVWGVERVIESAAENPLNRFEAYLEQKRRHEEQPLAEPTTVPGALRYRLTTEIPDYWIPLLPVRTQDGLRLRRGAVVKTNTKIESVSAQGRILEAGEKISLFEEEVPREGVRVTRSYQSTRWFDGSHHVWVGRYKGVGRGEGSSGLQFDSLDAKD